MTWLRSTKTRVPAEEVVDLLHDVEMFQGLDEKPLRRLAALFDLRRLDRDEILFCQGDPGDRIYLVQEGFLAVCVAGCRDGPGTGHVVLALGRGQSVGEMSLVDQGERSASVKAATDGTVVLSAPSAEVVALCGRCPRIGYGVMLNIAADLSFRLRHHDQET